MAEKTVGCDSPEYAGMGADSLMRTRLVTEVDATLEQQVLHIAQR